MLYFMLSPTIGTQIVVEGVQATFPLFVDGKHWEESVGISIFVICDAASALFGINILDTYLLTTRTDLKYTEVGRAIGRIKQFKENLAGILAE